jgi:hypothetical protein
MKNYLITEDQLEKIVNTLEDQNGDVSDEENYNPLSSLLNTKKEEPKLEKKDFNNVPSDDPVMKFIDSLK